MSTTTPTCYSAAFKRQAVDRLTGRPNVTALAAELGIRRKFLYQWRGTSQIGAKAKLGPAKLGPAKLEADSGSSRFGVSRFGVKPIRESRFGVRLVRSTGKADSGSGWSGLL